MYQRQHQPTHPWLNARKTHPEKATNRLQQLHRLATLHRMLHQNVQWKPIGFIDIWEISGTYPESGKYVKSYSEKPSHPFKHHWRRRPEQDSVVREKKGAGMPSLFKRWWGNILSGNTSNTKSNWENNHQIWRSRISWPLSHRTKFPSYSMSCWFKKWRKTITSSKCTKQTFVRHAGLHGGLFANFCMIGANGFPPKHTWAYHDH